MPQKQPGFPEFTLDAQQRRVVQYAQGALRVLGAAGSGKTEALIASVLARLGEAASSGGDVSRILVLAYDKHSALWLREEFARRIGSGQMPTVTTFHALAWAIVRQYSAARGDEETVRLLSGPEQDPRIREMLQWAVAEGAVKLPEEFDHALGTRGLAEEVRRLFAKAQQLGVSPQGLAELGLVEDVGEWLALSPFYAEYLDAIEAEGGIDYAAVLPRAARLLVARELEGNYVFDAIYVDEYQDVEPAQVGLLQALVRRVPNPLLAVFGSPDEMIFRFRGADPQAIVLFESDFADLVGRKPTTIALDNQYRLPEPIAKAAQTVVTKVPMGALPADAQRSLRSGCATAESESKSTAEPKVEIGSFLTAGAQYAQVADSIRRLKLSGAVQSWSDIAVIARSASQGIQNLEQVLVASGVPIVSLGSNVALREEPGVWELLTLLQVALAPEDMTKDQARAIALSPIGGLTPSQFRMLSRQLRDIATSQGEEPTSAADAFVKALLNPDRCRMARGPGSEKLLAIAELIERASVMAESAPAYNTLWELWSSTNWPQELQELALSPSSLSRSANRTLDAVVALFEVIRRGERVTGTSMSPRMLLDELTFQGFTPDLGSMESKTDGVHLMSAHSTKGKSWPIVFVIDLQEGVWPRVSHRVSLLSTDRLGAAGSVDAMSAIDQIRDERRLLYVALSRASDRVFVSCVSDDIESTRGSSPSRFFNELVQVAERTTDDGFVVAQNQGSVVRSLTTASLVAQLRHAVENPRSSVELKHAAANRLGILAEAGVRAADPSTWWGMRSWSVADKPVRDPDSPVRISGSAWKDLDECALKWFLDREAGGATARGTATAFGSVVHALADAVARGDVEPELYDLRARVELVWHKLGIESQWQNEREKAVVVDALDRFLLWQDAEKRGRKLIVTEEKFDGVVQTDFDADSTNVKTQANIVGIADRLELDAGGSTVVVDLKNQKNPPSGPEVLTHKQLWLYQLAVMIGAFDGEVGDWIPTTSGGAELIQLRTDLKTPGPKKQPQPPAKLEDLRLALRDAVEILRQEDFKANPKSDLCKFCNFKIVCPGQPQGVEVVN